MENPTLYRKRLIPEECIMLKDDVILHLDTDIMITKWTTLKPRSDFHHGYSCYFFHDGIKVSKFYREDNSLLYWYCDIVSYSYEQNSNSLYITDLLADVIITPDNHVKVLDINELCEAKEQGLLDEQNFYLSVKRLGQLLNIIETGDFPDYVKHLEAVVH